MTAQAGTSTESAAAIPLWAAAALSRFETAIAACSPFEAKGILHSEMLAFCGALEGLGIEHVIESGRARGQSTEVIARFIGDRPVAFDSVEYDSSSADVPVAEKRLAAFPDMRLHYGDSFRLVPKLLSDRPTAILIDGPKGFDGLRLAVEMATFPQIRLIAVHDSHRAAAELRRTITEIFPKAWFTDDESYVSRYSSMDEQCWKAYQAWPETAGYAPYKRDNRIMPSYGPTLAVIRSPALSRTEYRTALKLIARRRPKAELTIARLKSISDHFPDSIRKGRLFTWSKEKIKAVLR